MNTPKLSKLKIMTVKAYERGYRISPCGKCFSPRNKEMSPSYHFKTGLYYARMNFSGSKVYWHHLAAFQKYGEKWLYGSLLVRHLDGDSKNNSFLNIALGTKRDNTMDIPAEKRKRNLENAHAACRKFSDEQVRQIRERAKNETYYKIAKDLKCSPRTIDLMVKRTQYAHVT